MCTFGSHYFRYASMHYDTGLEYMKYEGVHRRTARPSLFIIQEMKSVP